MPLGVKKNFHWCFPSCSWSLQNPVISANAPLWEISDFRGEINWPASLSSFLNVPVASPLGTMLEIPRHGSCITSFLPVALCPCGPSHFLKSLFSSPGRTCKHTLLCAVRGEGSDFTVGMWFGNSRHVPFSCPVECWLLKVDWSASKVNKGMEKTDQLFFTSLHVYLERRGKQMLATILGSFSV